jgi:hypothetical protein
MEKSKRAYWQERYIRGAYRPIIRARLLDQQTVEELGSYLYAENSTNPASSIQRRKITLDAHKQGYKVIATRDHTRGPLAVLHRVGAAGVPIIGIPQTEER